MARKQGVPKYRHHRPSGQAVVSLRIGPDKYQDVYLGEYGSEASKLEYERVIGEWRQNSSKARKAGTTTVAAVCRLFGEHARKHYQRPDGTTTNELVEYQEVIRVLVPLYGVTPAADFGPLALKAVRSAMISKHGWARTTTNARVRRLKHIFKWAVAEQLVPVAVHAALATVSGLQKGRTTAREPEPVGPVADAVVDATLPFLNRHVRGLVEFQRLTGCRPGEAVQLRRCDLDESGAVWLYAPKQHKTDHRGRSRVVAVGPRAQAVATAFFVDDPAAYLFSPRRVTAELRVELRKNRKTPLYASAVARNAARLKAKPKREPGARYTPNSYSHAVLKACVKAGVEPWSPNQLRHSFASIIRKRYGLETAGATLGHSKMSATEIYAERDGGLAMQVAAEMG